MIRLRILTPDRPRPALVGTLRPFPDVYRDFPHDANRFFCYIDATILPYPPPLLLNEKPPEFKNAILSADLCSYTQCIWLRM